MDAESGNGMQLLLSWSLGVQDRAVDLRFQGPLAGEASISSTLSVSSQCTLQVCLVLHEKHVSQHVYTCTYLMR